MIEYIYSVLGRTSTLCLYNHSQRIPIVFPKVQTLALVQCTKINEFVLPSVFPNLRTIHYLSTPPVSYKRIANVKWIFPSMSHPFYQGMMEAGIGRIDEQLVTTYIDSMIPAEDGLMDISLHIPEYGMIDGERYEYYMRHFFTKNTIHNSPFDDYYQRSLTRRFMETIL